MNFMAGTCEIHGKYLLITTIDGLLLSSMLPSPGKLDADFLDVTEAVAEVVSGKVGVVFDPIISVLDVKVFGGNDDPKDIVFCIGEVIPSFIVVFDVVVVGVVVIGDVRDVGVVSDPIISVLDFKVFDGNDDPKGAVFCVGEVIPSFIVVFDDVVVGVVVIGDVGNDCVVVSNVVADVVICDVGNDCVVVSNVDADVVIGDVRNDCVVSNVVADVVVHDSVVNNVGVVDCINSVLSNGSVVIISDVFKSVVTFDVVGIDEVIRADSKLK